MIYKKYKINKKKKFYHKINKFHKLNRSIKNKIKQKLINNINN